MPSRVILAPTDPWVLQRRAQIVDTITREGPLDVEDLVNLFPLFSGFTEINAREARKLLKELVDEGELFVLERSRPQRFALPGACRRCGCTDELACEGGCFWIETDLCSACADLVAPVLMAALATLTKDEQRALARRRK